ncbi:hypothetical protein, partial [Texcoconibacillus texcoconensis]
MTEERTSKLSFSIDETVWLKDGQQVDQVRSLSLEPDIEIEESAEYLFIKGGLKLHGEYDVAEEDTEARDEKTDENLAFRSVEEVSVSDEGIGHINHRLPIDVTVPHERVSRADEVYVTIDHFDYDLPERGCLHLSADVGISGIQEVGEADIEEREEESKAQEEENSQDNNEQEDQQEEEEEYYYAPTFRFEQYRRAEEEEPADLIGSQQQAPESQQEKSSTTEEKPKTNIGSQIPPMPHPVPAPETLSVPGLKDRDTTYYGQETNQQESPEKPSADTHNEKTHERTNGQESEQFGEVETEERSQYGEIDEVPASETFNEEDVRSDQEQPQSQPVDQEELEEVEPVEVQQEPAIARKDVRTEEKTPYTEEKPAAEQRAEQIQSPAEHVRAEEKTLYTEEKTAAEQRSEQIQSPAEDVRAEEKTPYTEETPAAEQRSEQIQSPAEDVRAEEKTPYT